MLVLTHSKNGISKTFCAVRHPGSTHRDLSIAGGVKQTMENQAFLSLSLSLFFKESSSVIYIEPVHLLDQILLDGKGKWPSSGKIAE